MLDNKVLIENIRRLCDKNDIKITNLEKELGFGAGIISRWGNDADPSLSKILQVAKHFKVSVDDIIGYEYIVEDKFLEKLILQTANKTIQWKGYGNEDNKMPKQYIGFDINSYDLVNQSDIDYFLETHKELSYYYGVNGGYISIYGYYKYHNVIKPEEIKLFIQPDYAAQLIEQDYSYEQLKPLWLKILYTIEADAPDEIKAEEFKMSFIKEFKNSQNNRNIIDKNVDDNY